jgi:hypothetical protein
MAQRATADAVHGNIVVINADATVLKPGELFDLEGATLTFTPKPGGHYGVDVGPSAFDTRLGTSLGMGTGGSATVPLGFSFKFYNRTWTSVFVNAAGTLTFVAADSTPHFNAGGSATSLGSDLFQILDRMTANPRIAALWQDWNPGAGGTVSLTTLSDRTIITWNAVPLSGFSLTASFQAALFADGKIQISYASVPATPPGGYLVGISPGSSFYTISTTVDFSRGPTGTLSAFPSFEPLIQVFGATAAPVVHLPAVARKLYALLPDRFDELVVFTSFQQTTTGVVGTGFDNNYRRPAAGIGEANPYNNTSFVGSGGRLTNIVNMNDLNRFPDDPLASSGPSFMSFLAHETGHAWLARVKFDDGGICSDLLLDNGNVHWSFYHNTDASVMFGVTWRNNGNGTFTSIEASLRYGALDQYLMGLRPLNEVPAFFFIRNPSSGACQPIGSGIPGDRACFPVTGVTVSGTQQNVSASQVLTCSGPRSPASGFSEVNPTTTWHQAWVLVVPAGLEPSATDLAKIDRFRSALEAFFNAATGGRATADTRSVDPTQTTSLVLNANRRTFDVGDPIRLDLVVNPGPLRTADEYFGALFPSGTGPLLGCPNDDAVFFGADGFARFIVSCLSTSPSQLAPLARSVVFVGSTPTLTKNFFGFPWPANVPAGTYTFFAVLTQAGTRDIIDLALANVDFGAVGEGSLAPNCGNPPCGSGPVAVTRWRFTGGHDDLNPNDEFIELTLDPRFAPSNTFDLGGFSLRNNRGDTFAFPTGSAVQDGRPIRIYTGSGVSTATILFWGLGHGAWDDSADCIRLVRPNGSLAYRVAYGRSGLCD